MFRIGRLLHTENLMEFPRHYRFRKLSLKLDACSRVLAPGSVAVLLVGCGPAGTPRPSPPLVAAARRQIGVTTEYDPAYVTLAYPGGDVPIRTYVFGLIVNYPTRWVDFIEDADAARDARRPRGCASW